MVRRASFAFVLATVLATPKAAQTAEPSSTTATYGNWTVTCSAVAETSPPVRACQMTTKLNLKVEDGSLRPLLEIAIGLPPGAKAMRIVLQVPIDVALRAPIMISVDAGAGGTVPMPQTDLLTASYFACTSAGCLADADFIPEASAVFKKAKTVNVSFVALNGGKKITVPVEMTGFADAWGALGLPAP